MMLGVGCLLKTYHRQTHAVAGLGCATERFSDKKCGLFGTGVRNQITHTRPPCPASLSSWKVHQMPAMAFDFYASMLFVLMKV
jgi:hypothetical protein